MTECQVLMQSSNETPKDTSEFVENLTLEEYRESFNSD